MEYKGVGLQKALARDPRAVQEVGLDTEEISLCCRVVIKINGIAGPAAGHER